MEAKLGWHESTYSNPASPGSAPSKSFGRLVNGKALDMAAPPSSFLVGSPHNRSPIPFCCSLSSSAWSCVVVFVVHSSRLVGAKADTDTRTVLMKRINAALNTLMFNTENKAYMKELCRCNVLWHYCSLDESDNFFVSISAGQHISRQMCTLLSCVSLKDSVIFFSAAVLHTSFVISCFAFSYYFLFTSRPTMTCVSWLFHSRPPWLLLARVLYYSRVGSNLKTAFASVHELSVHVHERCAGTVHVHVRFVPENSCCTVVHG